MFPFLLAPQSALQAAATVIYLKHKSDHITPTFKTIQWFSTELNQTLNPGLSKVLYWVIAGPSCTTLCCLTTLQPHGPFTFCKNAKILFCLKHFPLYLLSWLPHVRYNSVIIYFFGNCLPPVQFKIKKKKTKKLIYLKYCVSSTQNNMWVNKKLFKKINYWDAWVA